MAKNNPLISIITVNYNGKKYLSAFFESIKKSNFNDYELIFVDNNSVDDSLAFTKEKYPWVKIVVSKNNLGFAAGNNLGVKNAEGKYLFFINNDTKIEIDCLEKLIATAEKYKKPAMYVCTLKSYDKKTFISLGNYTDVLGCQVEQGRGKIFFADGTAFFLDREIFEKTGGFDEDYFMFNEDLDFCWRALLLGYQIYPIKDAVIYHKSGGTAVGGFAHQNQKYQTTVWRRYMGERNELTTVLKNYSSLNLIWIIPIYFLVNLAEIFALAISGNFRVIAGAYFNSWFWQFKNFKSILDKRKKIQITRKVSDREIIKKMYKGSAKWLNFLKIGWPKFR